MFKNFFKGLARAFTLPAKERAYLNNNPLSPVVKSMLASELSSLVQQSTAHITNIDQKAAVQSLILAGIDHSGVLK